MITIENNGADIVATNYWGTEHAARGLCYLSGNAGHWRLLVPRVVEHALSEMRAGKSVIIESSTVQEDSCDVVFDDRTAAPFSLSVDRRQIDRSMTSRSCQLTVWTEAGKVLTFPCEIRV